MTKKRDPGWLKRRFFGPKIDVEPTTDGNAWAVIVDESVAAPSPARPFATRAAAERYGAELARKLSGRYRGVARGHARRDASNGNPKGLRVGDVVFDKSDPNTWGAIKRFEYDHRYGGAEGMAIVQRRASIRSASVHTERGHVASEFRAKESTIAIPTRSLIPLVRQGRETRERAGQRDSASSSRARHAADGASFAKRAESSLRSPNSSVAAIWYLKAGAAYAKAGNQSKARYYTALGKDLRAVRKVASHAEAVHYYAAPRAKLRLSKRTGRVRKRGRRS